MPNPKLILPPTYYHDHFSEMVDFVVSLYGEFLEEDHKTFIQDFQSLPQDAQCLYIRMINRKKPAFGYDDLNYSEIENIEDCLNCLYRQGFLRGIEESDYHHFLTCLSKSELLNLAKLSGMDSIKTGWSKPKLTAFLFENLTWGAFTKIYKPSEYFVPSRREAVQFLLYLYFGRLNDNFISFTLRDLGIVSVRHQKNYQARFQHIGEARAGFFYDQALRKLKTAGAAEISVFADNIEKFPLADTDFTADLRDNVIYKLGQFFEKQKETDKAIAIYSRSASFDSRERLIRLLHAKGEADLIKDTLETMLANPAHDEEYIFASDFYQRKFSQSRIGVFTDLLRNSHMIEADDLYRSLPELAAIRHFENQGWSCHHTENGLWPSLFGLIFWDELFEAPDALSSSFDWIPQALKNKTFHLRHASTIEQKIQSIKNGHGRQIVAETIARNAGNDNGIFTWFDDLESLMGELLDASPPEAITHILDLMVRDFYAHRDGFPDLMMTKDGVISFVEIKGEGDQVRRNQLARLNLLKRAGFDAYICRVRYRVDPEQTYVVIDVETTGGRPPYDRVTEIGAVKIRNGKVIDEWQSLINPERRIPSFITQLTGISQDMVSGAPRFSEIANDLETFLEGSVFVAHNVNFDHGFIASEFARLEKNFRYPKLCTVSSMRRHYPGHSSYGLANLCREYGITLENHHRALDDARAAAELLKMVNQKRLMDA